jgi:MFS family permease
LSGDLWWIAVIQIVSGFAWAAYELGMFLTLFDSLPPQMRTKVLTYYNFASSIAICIGALAGASLLTCYGSCQETYYILFGLSSIGRMICLGLLLGLILPSSQIRFIATRVLSVRPGAGSIVAPITASVECTRDETPATISQ